MSRYILEVCGFSEWESEAVFHTMRRAMKHGLENLQQNDWRVVDSRTGDVLHTHSGLNSIVGDAVLEQRRFQHTEEWRERFANQRAAEIRAEAREQEAQRQRAANRERYQPIEEDEVWPCPPERKKVNWIKEGF